MFSIVRPQIVPVRNREDFVPRLRKCHVLGMTEMTRGFYTQPYTVTKVFRDYDIFNQDRDSTEYLVKMKSFTPTFTLENSGTTYPCRFQLKRTLHLFIFTDLEPLDPSQYLSTWGPSLLLIYILTSSSDPRPRVETFVRNG